MPRWAKTSGTAMTAVVMAVLLLAAILKLRDLAGFEASLYDWSLLPAGAVPAAALSVPVFELMISLAWLFGIARRAAWCAAGLLLAIFTAAYLAHLWWAEAPTCRCFGVQLKFQSQQQEAKAVLLRNLVLMTLLVVGAALSGFSVSRSEVAQSKSSELRRSAPRRAFSILELLLVIALIGLLVALLIPSLGRISRDAKRLTALSDLRAHIGIVTQYCSDHSETFPYPTNPEATYTILRHPEAPPIRTVYFGASNLWHWPLLESYYPNQARTRVFEAPGNDRYPFTSYWYSATFLARPEFWEESTRTGPNQWKPTKQADVLFPSAKGIFFNGQSMFIPIEEWYGLDHKVQLALVDGSARSVPFNDLSKGYPRGEGDWHGSWFSNGLRIMHTRHGVRGRDMR